jgi:hypothetical protein
MRSRSRKAVTILGHSIASLFAWPGASVCDSTQVFLTEGTEIQRHRGPPRSANKMVLRAKRIGKPQWPAVALSGYESQCPL